MHLLLGIGTSLILYTIVTVLVLFRSMKVGDLSLSLSPITSYGVVMLVCFFMGWRYRMNPFLSVPIAYGFFWLTSLIANRRVLVATWDSSPTSLVALLFIAPISLAFLGLLGAILGRFVRRLI